MTTVTGGTPAPLLQRAVSSGNDLVSRSERRGVYAARPRLISAVLGITT